MESTPRFTKQEHTILKLLADGKQNKYIADTLCLSVYTIKNHKANICQKLNLQGCTDLYRWCALNATMLQKDGGGKFKFFRIVKRTVFGSFGIISKKDYFLFENYV
jgi:DNA-binding CsgD family transcriptional regulator